MKKTILLFALILLRPVAYASYYQVSCSDAEGLIATHHGHSKNKVELTVFDTTVPNPQGRKMAFELNQIKEENLQQVEISNESRTECREGQNVGYRESSRIYWSKVKLSRTDGRPFSENIIGISKNKMFIEVILLCKNYMNSMIPCP